jgi:hypothetical protein
LSIHSNTDGIDRCSVALLVAWGLLDADEHQTAPYGYALIGTPHAKRMLSG